MRTFRNQYLPTETGDEDSNRSNRDRKKQGDIDGKAWTSKYLFHIPLKRVWRKKKDSESDTDDNTRSVTSSILGEDDHSIVP